MAKKTFRVIGAHRVVIERVSHGPGEEFQATLPPDQEQILVDAGQIEVVAKQKEEAS